MSQLMRIMRNTPAADLMPSEPNSGRPGNANVAWPAGDVDVDVVAGQSAALIQDRLLLRQEQLAGLLQLSSRWEDVVTTSQQELRVLLESGGSSEEVDLQRAEVDAAISQVC